MTELNELNNPADLIEKTSENEPGPETLPESQAKPSNRERWILFFVAGIVLLLDQGTKYLIQASIPTYTYWAPFPKLVNIFRITHTTNTGVAFGLFPNGNTLFAIFAIVVSIAIIYYNQTLSPGHRLLRLALGLQMGGAVGNLISRIFPGYVVDFLDFGPWPVFNVADIAIVSGTILLAGIMLQEERSLKDSSKEESNHEKPHAERPEKIGDTMPEQANEGPTS